MIDPELADFDYDLPPDRIAQQGLEPRDSSRLLVVCEPFEREFEHRIFRELPEYLNPGDLLVLNESRVIPARLWAIKSSGARIEVMLLHEQAPNLWTAYLKPGRRARVGTHLNFTDDGSVAAVVEGVLEDGARVLRFLVDIKPRLSELGLIPLPPYISLPELREGDAQASRYQTVFARDPGSVAAPTAGLHFTARLLAELESKGVRVLKLSLHVGAGTFKPITGSIQTHLMHAEPFEILPEVAAEITEAKRGGRRVIAVGTTVVRALESAWVDGCLRAGLGETRLFIRPPHHFAVVDAMITNFHLPRSTLLMLVGAFVGVEVMKKAYAEALSRGYRFYSFGDAMLLFRNP